MGQELAAIPDAMCFAGESRKTETKLILIAALTALLPQAGVDGDDQTATDDYQQFCE